MLINKVVKFGTLFFLRTKMKNIFMLHVSNEVHLKTDNKNQAVHFDVFLVY